MVEKGRFIAVEESSASDGKKQIERAVVETDGGITEVVRISDAGKGDGYLLAANSVGPGSERAGEEAAAFLTERTGVDFSVASTRRPESGRSQHGGYGKKFAEGFDKIRWN